MALRDYYRCKKCDAKVVYGPDRSDEDWEPFLLCRACVEALEQENTRIKAGKGWYEDSPAGFRKHYTCSEVEELKQAALEIDALKAQLARYERAVTDEECARRASVMLKDYFNSHRGMGSRARVFENGRQEACNVLDEIARRTAGPDGEGDKQKLGQSSEV